MINEYYKTIQDLITTIKEEEKNKINLVADKVAKSIETDGIVHFFGAGHSHILCEEVFYRAGGLVPINPIFDENLMLHNGALRSSKLERMSGYAQTFMESVDIRPGEIVFVISTSGRNGVPIDVALLAKEKGAEVVAITSVEYSMSQPSRHSSGKRLFEVADIYIDNHCPEGDALLSLEGFPMRFSPGSTIAGCFIIQAILATSIKIMVNNGTTPPVFLSGNLDGGDEHNKKLIEKYKDRIVYYR
ncbi:hypothetical protein TSYNTROOL_07870 [Tepidanaerobacter syntrophicus]|uniref:SIS domain-containing protein n=1 Tax=Tepidanaerobacter syntrophicus TaxID=224999 RepID=UPI0022EDE455|nr:SIS domain-containing protein [Tepidanaerobacter syntrophicus]GLI50701.1 hypothetical protein TSYNTROOL_07870 [Tepidanaerobacter syntrophicus]